MKIYQVGGSVRDSFLGIKSKDIDYAVEASSYDEMREYILSTNGEIFLENPEFFTIRAKWSIDKKNKEPCDFVLCRKEGSYSDNRHPDNVEVGTIFDDLARRDFTINAIAINVETQEIIDPFGGIKDIEDKIIQCVGNPDLRFKEDALRILRALRFAITKNFKIAYLTDICMSINMHLLSNISSERIREELHKMFKFDTNKSVTVIHNFKMSPYIFNEKTKIWLKPTMEM
jgi:tRNA nucleotidyltransferase (CCA-adding enzyme)